MYRLGISIAIVFVLLVSPVWAADEPRKIDFTVVLMDLDGKPVPSKNEKDAPPLTLGGAASNALLAPFNDENPNGQEKIRRFILAMKVHNTKDVELTVDEAHLIIDLVRKGYPALVVGRVTEILDPAALR